MDNKKSEQTKLLIIILVGILAIVGVVVSIIVIFSDKDTPAEEIYSETTTASAYQFETDIQIGNMDINFTRADSFSDDETSESETNSDEKKKTEASTVAKTTKKEKTTAKQTDKAKNPTTTKKAAASNQSLSAKKFSDLGISGFELRKIKYLTTHYGFWYTGKLKDNSETINTIGYYIQEFASDYGLTKSNNWKAAPEIFDDYIEGTGMKVAAVLSIEEFNKILKDIYGPSAEQLSYSDFPEFLELNSIYDIWHSLGGSKGSYNCTECLVIVAPIHEFESNDVWPDFTGFKINGNLISALWLEYSDYPEWDEPVFMLNQESYFAKGNNGYYLHSINPDIYGGGSSSGKTLESLSSYEIYDHTSGENKLVDLSVYYPELKTTKAASQNTGSVNVSSVEQAYVNYLADRRNNGIDADFSETDNEGYSFFDLNSDGINEMIIIGEVEKSGGWHYCRLYTCNPETYTVKPASDLIFYYSVVRYSVKHSSLVYCPEKSSYSLLIFRYTKFDGKYSYDYFDYSCETDKNGNKTSSVYYFNDEEAEQFTNPDSYAGENIDIKTKPVADIAAK